MAKLVDTSASEIANYRGNASAGGAGDPGGVRIAGSGELDQVSDAFNIIAQQNMLKNKGLYDAKMKAQEELRKQLADDDAQLNVMLPKDREELTSKFREPIRKLLLENPNITQNHEKYLELQGLMNDFREAKAYAGVRLQTVADFDNNIGAETDPEKRKRMTEHRNNQYNQGLYDKLKPYQEVLDFTDNIFAKVPAIETLSPTTLEGDFKVNKKSFITPLKAFNETVRFNYLDSRNTKLKNEMDEFARSVSELPALDRAKTIQAWNDKIAEANLDHGYKEGDKDYVPPVQTQTVKNELGEDEQVIVDSPINVVRAQSILDYYKKGESETRELDPKIAEIAKDRADIDRINADAYLKRQEAKLVLPAQRAKLLADAEQSKAAAKKSLAEARNEDEKGKDKQAVGDWYINQTLAVFDRNRFNNVPTIQNYMRDTQLKANKKQTDYQVAGKDVTAFLSPVEKMSLGKRIKIDGKTSILEPDAVVYQGQNSKDPFFMARYTYTKKNAAGKDETVTEVRQIRPNGVIENLIKGVVGEESAGKENEDYKQVSRRFRERAGSENINSNLFLLYDKAEWKAQDDKLSKDFD
jgi:hypothetical protein